MTTLSPEQAVRQDRARTQASNYKVVPNFRHDDAFDVINLHSGAYYTVSPEGCNCPDATSRSEGKCKHWHLCRDHVAKLTGVQAAPAPAPAMSAEKRAQVLKDRELWA
jgi:hypothetical protein